MQAFRFQKEGRFQAGQSAPHMDLLPPEPAPRSRPFAATRRPDVVDAEFETVPARRTSHRVFNDNRAGAFRRPPMTVRDEQISVGGLLAAMLAEAASHLERLLGRVPPAAFAGLVAALCGAAFLLVAAVSGGPSAAMPRGLVITDVSTRLGDANGMRVISVYGTIENPTDELQTVPVIEINVAADGRAKTAARILSGASILAPGESRPFAARLPHAGGKLPDVTVSFSKPGAPTR